MAAYIAPQVLNQFETLSAELKDIILKRNVQINNLQDLINVLEDVVKEGEQ